MKNNTICLDRVERIPEKVYIVYSTYEDGSEGILSFEYDHEEAIKYCRRMQAKMECRIYVREYSKTHDIIVL